MGSTKYEARNARAVSELRAWLRALEIPFAPGRVPGTDITTFCVDGSEIPLQIRADDSPPAPAEAIVLEARVLTGRSITAALALFRSLVEMLGYEWRPPVSRGPVPTKKAHYGTDFEGVAFRHAEFHRSPNPSPSDLEHYHAVIKQEATGFLRRYATMCQDEMLGLEDLVSYGQVWACNYLTLHAVATQIDNNNERKLASYLHQRFSELRQLIWKRGRNVYAHLDDAHIALQGTPFEAHPEASSFLVATFSYGSDEIDEAYVARRCEIDTKNPLARKLSARRKLAESLAALPHHAMLEVLTGASTNTCIDPAAQRQAALQLRKHAGACPTCRALAAAKANEQPAGRNPLRTLK